MSASRTRGASLRAALILNAVFLILTVVIVRVGFESNDDPTLAAFVDGQMANSTAYVPYINIVLGALLKGIYTVLGREIAWHTFCQYALLYLAFTALSFTLCERLGALRGAVVTTVLLLFFGVDVYCIINYTKTAAVCTVGGMALLLYALEKEGRHRFALIFGLLLTVLGFLLRDMEFLPCFALMAVLFAICPSTNAARVGSSLLSKPTRTITTVRIRKAAFRMSAARRLAPRVRLVLT